MAVGLKARVLGAGKWIVAGHVASLAIRFGTNLVLTRLLAPEMFGLMALVLVVSSGLAMLSDVGIRPIVVQSPRGDDPSFLNTAWTVQVIRGAMLWTAGAAVGLAIWWFARRFAAESGTVYADPQLPLVIAIYAFTQFIAGLLPAKLLSSRRRLLLARLTVLDLVAQLFAFVVTLVSAAAYPSVWALVAGGVAGAAFRLSLTWVYLPGPACRFEWDRAAVREILSFGRWVFLSSSVAYLVTSGDRLMLGALVSPAELGIYSIAFLFASVPQTTLSQLMNHAAFPALSEIARSAPERIGEVYYRLRHPFDGLALVMMGVFAVAGESIIGLLYDPRYHAAGPILEVLALSAIAYRYQLADQCYLAMGRSDIVARIHVLRLVLLYSLVPMAFRIDGARAAIWAIALTPIISMPAMIYYKRKFGLLNLGQELVLLWPLVAGIACGGMIEFGIRHLAPQALR